MTAALRDAIGVEHPRVDAAQECRIVSLVPSVTELICALGLAPALVGRTGFCIHPRLTLEPIPKIGGTKDVNIDKIRQLAPTHLLVNIDENEKPTVDTLSRFVPNVIVTHPVAPEDNLSLYRLLGGIFGKEREAESLCAFWRSPVIPAAVSAATKKSRPPSRLVLHLARSLDDRLAGHVYRAHAGINRVGAVDIGV